MMKASQLIHKTKLIRPALLALFCLGFVFFLPGCSNDVEPLRFSGPTMGTTYNVAIVPDDTAGQCSKDRLAKEIDASLVDTNQHMSHYIADSELSQLSRAPINEALELSAQMFELLSLSEGIYQASDGSFDITLGPLVNLWGFGPKSSVGQDSVPSDSEINAALALIGADSLLIDQNKRQLTRTKAVRLNFSAVAKGYGADRIAKVLDNCKVANYLVEVGGEMMLKGNSHRGSPWKIAVEKPSTSLAAQSVQRIIGVTDRGVATSGDYRNYFENNGVRYSHTIDPRTGRPISHNLASVTVLANSSAEADAWATAISVMGPEHGMAAAEKEGLAIYMLVKTSSGFKERYSSAFESYIK